MNIGIYSESTRGTADVGGSELVVVTLASELRALGHTVDVIHHNPTLTGEFLSQRFGVDPASLRLRYTLIEPQPSSTHPWRRHREEEAWYGGITASYDMFINVVHQKPPICRAKIGVLYVLFPFFDAASLWSRAADPAPGRPLLLRLYRKWYHRWNWHRIMRSYQLRAAISDFSGYWTRQRWEIATKTIYPPATAGAPAAATKQDLIVSVGRFAGGGVSKKQLEMMQAFQQVAAADAEWQYRCIGGLSSQPEDTEYFRQVQSAAVAGRTSLEPNLPRAAVDAAYASAKIFWHATGAGDDETTRPEMSEHYGIATVEAMLSGCVPVVIKRGAQPEIVEHGVNGFLWETVDELKHHTIQLMRDDALRERLSTAARLRAAEFTRDKFVRRFLDFLKPVLREP